MLATKRVYFPFKRAAANDDALRVRYRDRPFKQCMRDEDTSVSS